MNLQPSLPSLNSILFALFAAVAVLGSVIFGSVALYFTILLWLRNRSRESESLNSTLLQVTVPRENEIKIDAAEQMFSALHSLRRTRSSDKLAFFKSQPHMSFEIVGLPGDIRFYVNVPNRYRDFIEKQINGAYPDAEIVPVNEPSAKQKEGTVIGTEYNIFSQEGKVAFRSLRLRSNDYMPIRIFKDLPTDPLSSITSILAKMGEGEGATVQIIIQPAASGWKKIGRNYIGSTKKSRETSCSVGFICLRKKTQTLRAF